VRFAFSDSILKLPALFKIDSRSEGAVPEKTSSLPINSKLLNPDSSSLRVIFRTHDEHLIPAILNLLITVNYPRIRSH
jgi:hypothetical protein